MGGNKASKIVALPIPQVLRKLQECIIPDDRETILDLIEMIDINLLNPDLKTISIKQLRDEDGIPILVKLMKRMIEGGCPLLF
jgi:hypothetical protein